MIEKSARSEYPNKVLDPEHVKRRGGHDNMDDHPLHPEIKAAYNYVDSVLDTSDFKDAYAWYGWAVREAFLAGISFLRGIDKEIMVTINQDEFNRLTADSRAYQAINTPEIHDFLAAVENEALHQRERWGSEHDAGKTDADWFWLIGYLAGKALHAGKGELLPRYRHVKRGGIYEVIATAEDENNRGTDLVIYRGESDHKIFSRPAVQFYDGRFERMAIEPNDKLLHHIITTAAACLNWHAYKTGSYKAMRPGIDDQSLS
jgi:hypothetical protein